MRRTVGIVVGLLVVVGAVAASATTSQAAAPKMTVTGSVVAGVTSVYQGQDLVFDFTDKNTGTTTNPNNIFYYTYTNSSYVDIVCPLANGQDINPDTPACEPGALAGGKSTQSAIIVQATGPGPIVVKACVGPTGTTVCKSLTVKYGG